MLGLWANHDRNQRILLKNQKNKLILKYLSLIVIYVFLVFSNGFICMLLTVLKPLMTMSWY